jgi:quinol monooxygenase YgiN
MPSSAGGCKDSGRGYAATERGDASVEEQKRIELLGIARFKLHDGKLEEFKRLSAEVLEIVRTRDTGTLQFDIYFNDDQSESIVVERYKDSSALMEHAGHVKNLTEAIFTTGSVSSEMLGEPSTEIRTTMAGGEVRLFTPFLSL